MEEIRYFQFKYAKSHAESKQNNKKPSQQLSCDSF